MQDTGQILRDNAVLLVFLGAAETALDIASPPWSFGSVPFWALMALLIAARVFLYILCLGFYRAAYEVRREAVPGLVRLGARFFWRQVGVGVLLALAVAAVVGLAVLLVHLVAPAGRARVMLNALAVAISVGLLLKPLVLSPAIVLVVDCDVMMAFRLLRFVPLMKAGRVWALLVTQFVWIVLGGFVMHDAPGGYPGSVAGAIFRAVSWLLATLVTLEAMRHVEACGITHDRVEKWVLRRVLGPSGAPRT
ncbi:MAG: hypothetical protein V1873_08260 [Verrucomicrobiota bacterium]